MVTGMMLALMLGCDLGGWREAVGRYRSSHPAAGVQDLYKLAHQGILGSEHAVRDTARVRGWLTRELGEVRSGARRGAGYGAAVEPLPPDGRFVRVHLRPYAARGGDPERLLTAFVATANRARGDTAAFACAERALAGVEGFGAYVAARRREGFPAVHHSEGYEGAYGPAYRVVERTRW
jgi:hypothetical protein